MIYVLYDIFIFYFYLIISYKLIETKQNITKWVKIMEKLIKSILEEPMTLSEKIKADILNAEKVRIDYTCVGVEHLYIKGSNLRESTLNRYNYLKRFSENGYSHYARYY